MRKMIVFFVSFLLTSQFLFANPSILRGKASWYGSQFNGKLTANGERFNMNHFTAAHKSLPFGTILKVTNLENNKSVNVRVNDRGPFVKDRILDLSKKAAEALGYDKIGVAVVEAQVIKLGSPKKKKSALIHRHSQIKVQSDDEDSDENGEDSDDFSNDDSDDDSDTGNYEDNVNSAGNHNYNYGILKTKQSTKNHKHVAPLPQKKTVDNDDQDVDDSNNSSASKKETPSHKNVDQQNVDNDQDNNDQDSDSAHIHPSVSKKNQENKSDEFSDEDQPTFQENSKPLNKKTSHSNANDSSMTQDQQKDSTNHDPKSAKKDSDEKELSTVKEDNRNQPTEAKNNAKLEKTPLPEGYKWKQVESHDVAVVKVSPEKEEVKHPDINTDDIKVNRIFVIQFGAFSDLDRANLYKEELEKIGVDTYIAKEGNPGSILYKVRQNKTYRNLKEVFTNVLKFKKMGLDTFAVGKFFVNK